MGNWGGGASNWLYFWLISNGSGRVYSMQAGPGGISENYGKKYPPPLCSIPSLQFLYFFKTYRCFFLFFLLVSRCRLKLFCRIRLLAQKTVVKKFAEIKTRKFHSYTVPKHCLNICTKTNPVPIGVHTTVNVWFLCTYCTYVHTNLYTVASAPFTWQAWFLCGDPD